ncbi:cytochrome b/b6 domain-containing protein [Modicisalibacter sp. MOD 31.J]|uniref:cytochrome b n=1 Tax=Modicisalibacter sp. MOD 31.J TaxID=2831897 RepID=UPI001CCFA218|nr:cytochrome b/b6 domain-containing protein [Modicisalibacter sp. MOD 31.J]MBZ9574591.1 cytochrome b/b6 domain-containing protein [Modicisalibacter sp. MOD 31.J]
MIGNAKYRYGFTSRCLHWLVAFLIGWQMLKLTDYIADGEHWIGQTLVPWHVSIGTLLLLVIGLRAVWASRYRRRTRYLRTGRDVLISAGHLALYATMLLMPLTGIFKMIGGGHGLAAFGVVLIPEAPEIALAASLGEWHAPLSWLLLALIVGHIGFALRQTRAHQGAGHSRT